MVYSPTLAQFQGLFAVARRGTIHPSLRAWQVTTMPHHIYRGSSTEPCQYISKPGHCLVGIASLKNLQVLVVQQHPPFSPRKGAYHPARLIW